MADKEKAGDESYEFLPPDFDEDQFIHREMVSFKTTGVLFVWGIIAALASWAVFGALGGTGKTGWFVGLLICGAFFAALPVLFRRFKADLKHWGRREWLGTAFLFFFTWLGIFIVAVNPPISDYAAPRVDLLVGPPVQQAGGLVAVDVFYEDNDRVTEHTFAVSQGGTAIAGEDALVNLGRGHYQYTANLPPGVYDVHAGATDGKGNTEESTATITVVEAAVDIYPAGAKTLASPADQILVQVHAGDLATCPAKKGVVSTRALCIRTVHLDHADGTQVTMEYSKTDAAWKATNNFLGWRQGDNVVNVSVDLVRTYHGSVPVEGGRINAGPITVTVTATPGTYVPKVPADPGAHQRAVPDLGLPLLAVGLVAAVAFARRR